MHVQEQSMNHTFHEVSSPDPTLLRARAGHETNLLKPALCRCYAESLTRSISATALRWPSHADLCL